MGGISLEYRIDDKEALALIERLDHFNRAALLDDIGAGLHTLTMDRFLTSTSPHGITWEPSIRALLEGGKTLVDQGHLRDSFTWQIFMGLDGLEFGSDMIYAAIHQSGGKAGRNHAVELPARPILPDEDLPDEYLDVIADILTEHAARLLH